jgi:UDP-N-acetylglucosamine acyltransferase
VIHPTAIIDPKAQISPDVVIGPFCVIGPNVTLAGGCVIGQRVSMDWTRASEGVKIGANTIIGGDPQVYGWKSVPSWVEIGPGAFINELSVVHRSAYEGGATAVGPACYIMTQTHIAHDCILGREVTLTSFAGFAGHVEVGDYAVIGGATAIHQFARIGTMAMVGGMSRISQDVPPYFTVAGSPAQAHGLNLYALKKRGVKPAERLALKKAFHILARSGLLLAEALRVIEETVEPLATVKNLVQFARSSKRGLTLGGGRESEMAGED